MREFLRTPEESDFTFFEQADMNAGYVAGDFNCGVILRAFTRLVSGEVGDFVKRPGASAAKKCDAGRARE